VTARLQSATGPAVVRQRRRPRQLEHAEQVALIAWARMAERRIPALRYLIAIPNGGKRDARTAAALKREGVKPGVSDLLLAYPCHGRHGLWIEMKARHGGEVSASQEAWVFDMRVLGYAAGVAYGWLEARELIEDYLAGGARGFFSVKSPMFTVKHLEVGA
jgi:hypothetical protein